MPLTAAKTKSELEKLSQRSSNPTNVHVNLIFKGVKVKPVEIYEALDTKFGTVASLKDTVAHDDYTFEVTP
jgi:hypothetical protein